VDLVVHRSVVCPVVSDFAAVFVVVEVGEGVLEGFGGEVEGAVGVHDDAEVLVFEDVWGFEDGVGACGFVVGGCWSLADGCDGADFEDFVAGWGQGAGVEEELVSEAVEGQCPAVELCDGQGF